MNYLVRKIARAKWAVPTFATNDTIIAADAVTGCLRTSKNTLSFWQSHSEEKEDSDIKDVVLALVSNMERLDTLDIIVIPKSDLGNFPFEVTKGNIPVIDLQDRHLDMVKLTLEGLNHLARYIASKVRAEIRCYRFRKRDLEEVVIKAVKDGRLNLEDLSDRQKTLKDEILKKMNEQGLLN